VVYNGFYPNFGAFYETLATTFAKYRGEPEFVKKNCNAAKYLVTALGA